MSISRAELPYGLDGLEPHISSRTMSMHYDRHHKTYVDKLNGMIDGNDYGKMSLEEIVAESRAKSDTPVFNNSAQSWNHDFLWASMSPSGGGEPNADLKTMIEKAFGSVDEFKDAFKASALGQFGSGWTWLVNEGGALKIVSTSNAETPLGTGATPLLTLDVWEHAYYLDYQNERNRYVDTFLSSLINWDFAAKNLDAS